MNTTVVGKPTVAVVQSRSDVSYYVQIPIFGPQAAAGPWLSHELKGFELNLPIRPYPAAFCHGSFLSEGEQFLLGCWFVMGLLGGGQFCCHPVEAPLNFKFVKRVWM